MRNHKTKGAIEKSEKILDYISANSEQGVTIKEIAATFNIPAETVRRHVRSLFNDGYIDRKKQGYGSTHRYFWKKPEDQTQSPMEDKDKEEMGGVERDPDTIIKCGEFCKPGDVVECSSRSGEGLFFKYLVLIPWERKAMVLGIFPEGHPNLNLNDPNHIYIGDDPETGNKLYVDITNVCQRGYKTFGKRFFHAEKERMDDVKSRLKRVLQLNSVSSSATISSLNLEVENKRLRDDNKTLKMIRADASNEILDLKDKLETAKRDLAIQSKQYEQRIDDLKATLMIANGAAQDYESRYTLQKKEIEKLKEENQKVTEDLAASTIAGGDYLNYKERVEQLEEDNRVLKNENEEFRQQLIEFSHGKEPIDPKYVESLEAKYGDALIKLKAAETRVEDYDYFTDVMKDIAMKALDKGGN